MAQTLDRNWLIEIEVIAARLTAHESHNISLALRAASERLGSRTAGRVS